MNKYFIKKKKLYSSIIINIEKEFLNSSNIKLESSNILNKVIYTSLGSIFLDISIGIKRGSIKKIVEINGPISSNKTTLALNIILEIQKNGGKIAFIDIDKTLDIYYIRKFGIKIDKLFIIQPNSINKGLKIANKLIKLGIIHFLIIKSINNNLIMNINANNLNNFEGCNNKYIKQLILKILKNDVMTLFINQLDLNIFNKKINFEIKKFLLNNYSSIRLNIKKIKNLKKNKEIIGNKIKIKVMNNKIIKAHRLIKLDILYKYGVSRELELLKLGIKSKILKKNKNEISYNTNILGYNYDSIYKSIKENKKISRKIEIKILNYFYKKIKSRD